MKGNWPCCVYISKHVSFKKIRQHPSSGRKGEIDSYLNFAPSSLASLHSPLARCDIHSWITFSRERTPTLHFQSSVTSLKHQNVSFRNPELNTNWTGLSGRWQSPGKEAEPSAPLPTGSGPRCACSAAVNLHTGNRGLIPASLLTTLSSVVSAHLRHMKVLILRNCTKK